MQPTSIHHLEIEISMPAHFGPVTGSSVVSITLIYSLYHISLALRFTAAQFCCGITGIINPPSLFKNCINLIIRSARWFHSSRDGPVASSTVRFEYKQFYMDNPSKCQGLHKPDQPSILFQRSLAYNSMPYWYHPSDHTPNT